MLNCDLSTFVKNKTEPQEVLLLFPRLFMYAFISFFFLSNLQERHWNKICHILWRVKWQIEILDEYWYCIGTCPIVVYTIHCTPCGTGGEWMLGLVHDDFTIKFHEFKYILTIKFHEFIETLLWAFKKKSHNSTPHGRMP